MNLSISNIAWNAEHDEDVFSLMRQYGFAGLEVAPTRIIAHEPYLHNEEAARWACTVRDNYGLCIPSVQSIWFGRSEKFFGSEKERRFLLDYSKSAVDFACAIGCKNLVFGCPKNRALPDGSVLSVCTDIAVEFFKELGDYAASKGTCVGMEANPAIYGTNFINTTEEALELINQVRSDGFKLNLDAGTMIHNKENVDVLRGNVRLINHVHVSEPNLKPIEEHAVHQDLCKLLHDEGYANFVSIEMGKAESLDEIRKAMDYVKGVFK